MANFIPKRTIASRMPGVSDGSLVVAKDTGDLYIDVEDNGVVKRVKLSDVVTGTYANITSLLAPLTGKIYFATDTHQLLQYSGGAWTVLGWEESEIIEVTGSTVNIALADNKIYYCTHSNISSITLTDSATLNYCTICFTAGTNMTFSAPVGSRSIGFDCSGGVFAPVAGKEYQIAIDKLNNILTLYILKFPY